MLRSKNNNLIWNGSGPRLETGHPVIGYRQMIGMRNQVIHLYDGVDVAVVYDTVREDLPPLLEALAGIVDREAR